MIEDILFIVHYIGITTEPVTMLYIDGKVVKCPHYTNRREAYTFAIGS